MNSDRAQLVETLEDAGLSPYQADAYVTVLEFGSAPATEIAEASEVPDPRIYDVLRDLDSLGYVETYDQESLHARANNLDTIIKDLQTRADRFTAATEEIERRWNEPSVEQSTVSIVTRFETVIENADEFIRDADAQVNVSMGLEHFQRLRPALRAATERGVHVNLSIHGWDGSEQDGSSLDTGELAEVCSEARHRRLPSPFVVIVDRTKTCFAPHAGSTNEYGVLVDDRTHTYIFYWYFLTTQWEMWEQIHSSSDDDPPLNYVDIRYCIRDVTPLLRDGAHIRIRIEGAETDTGDTRVVDGQLVDVVTGDGEVNVNSIANYGGRAGLILDTDDGSVEIGGWGAMVEEVEAHQITVMSVD